MYECVWFCLVRGAYWACGSTQGSLTACSGLEPMDRRTHSPAATHSCGVNLRFLLDSVVASCITMMMGEWGGWQSTVARWRREKRATEGKMMAQGNEDGSFGWGEEEGAVRQWFMSLKLDFLLYNLMICSITCETWAVHYLLKSFLFALPGTCDDLLIQKVLEHRMFVV